MAGAEVDALAFFDAASARREAFSRGVSPFGTFLELPDGFVSGTDSLPMAGTRGGVGAALVVGWENLAFLR